MVAGRPLRTVFFGTPEFALATLDALLASHHTIAAVVTQPDRPRDRGHRTSAPPVKARALAAGLPILQPLRLSDPAFLERLVALDADLGVVVAYGKILTEAILAAPKQGFVNVHASILPRFRGAAPVHRAILAGDADTGVSIMRVVKALDAGPVLAVSRRPIGPDETSDELERDLARLGADVLVTTVDRLARGTVTETPQDDAAATYAARLTRDDGRIDWTRPARRIHDQIRGLHPWPHAFTFLQGDRLILHRSRPADASTGTAPGTVIEATGDCLRVAAGTGSLDVLEIQAEGKRPMPARQFLAGHRLTSGDRFASSPSGP